MLFSVIFSADVPSNVSIKEYAPPNLRRLWTLTEGDEQYEYSYLEGRWQKGKHRKWTALLNRKQFDAFVEKLGLIAEDVQTMGSLGAPGFGFGWSPAVSFRNDDEDAILSAYISPIPQVQKESFNDRDWHRIRVAVINVYGNRPRLLEALRGG
jgi:hypothetical protein